MIPPVIVPVTYEEIILALSESIKDGNSAVKDLEQKITEYISSKHSIATSSGRTALYTLLKAYGIKSGDEVAMPAYMCSSVSDLLFNMKIKVNFIDIDKDTYNLDTSDLNEKINANTKAVIAVHMFGNPCEMSIINEIAKENGSIVIEDAAQAMGAEYKKEKVGTIGDSGFFSFNRGKPLTSLDGGAIVTNDNNVAQKCRDISNNFSKQSKGNQSKTFFKLVGYTLIQNRNVYRFVHNLARNEKTRCDININNIGTKYTNFQAELASTQLSKLDMFNNIRKNNANLIYYNLQNNKHIKLLNISSHMDPIFLRFPIRVDTSIRYDLMKQLQNNGIETSIVYPVALSKRYNNFSACENAEEVVKETIALPVHPQVTKKDVANMTRVLYDML